MREQQDNAQQKTKQNKNYRKKVQKIDKKYKKNKK